MHAATGRTSTTIAITLAFCGFTHAQEPLFEAMGGALFTRFGSSVSTYPDRNGDGVPEILVGAISGTSVGLIGTLPGRSILSGADGTLIAKLPVPPGHVDSYGWVVREAGDLDADGVADIAVGAPGGNPIDSFGGQAFAYSGANFSLIHSWHSDLEATGLLGVEIAAVGDMDGDGHDDLAIASGLSLLGLPGSVRVKSGRTGDNLFLLVGQDYGFSPNVTIDAAGDVDGDGLPDLVVGTNSQVMVFSASGALIRQFIVESATFSHEFYPAAVVGLGDRNNDGFADYAAASYDAADPADPGELRMFSGKTGLPFQVFDGQEPGDHIGRSLALIPDVDGDGQDDFAVLASATVLGTTMDETRVVSSATGLILLRRFHAATEYFPRPSLAGADLNQDGIGDLIIGRSDEARIFTFSGTCDTTLSYGAGTPGGTGLVPVLEASQNAYQGNHDFAVTVDETDGIIPALLMLGAGQANLPFAGGTLLVDPSLPFALIPFSTFGVNPGIISLPIPVAPEAAGVPFYAQAIVPSTIAPFGYQLSNGIRITVCE